MKTFFRSLFIDFLIISLTNSSGLDRISQYGFLATPYTGTFTFKDMVTINTGPIPGLPTGFGAPKLILGSVNTRSYTYYDYVDFCLGDVGDGSIFNKRLFQGGTNPSQTSVFNFGDKTVCVTNHGSNVNEDSFRTVRGIWKFVMIPIKSDGSFDVMCIACDGASSGDNRVGFNLIAYL